MMSRRLLAAALVLAAPLAALAGCNVSGLATDATSGHPTVDGAYDPGTADGGSGSADSGGGDSSVAQTYLGSPLCNASPAHGCYPDDPTTAKQCALAPDGGAYNPSGGYDNAPLACHVQPAADAAAPVCLPAGTGTDGAPCQASTDCAPRYECIVGDGTSGTCHKYCCSGNLECGTSQFCDIQPMAAASTTKVPVCMPIAPTGGCHLLDESSCLNVNTDDTCAVVRENGATSCVAVGPAKAGDPCDEDHCGRDLVCLGTPGERRCYQLCHTATAAECSSSQTCTGGLPLFPDSAIGICQ